MKIYLHLQQITSLIFIQIRNYLIYSYIMHHNSSHKKSHQHHKDPSLLQNYLGQTYQLSMQLKRYKEDMIDLTLLHQEVCHQLKNSQQKQCQMKQTIQTTEQQLKEQKNKYNCIKQQFELLQADYKALFDKLFTIKRVNFSDTLLKQSEMVIELSDLKALNYKNGANFYQNIINTNRLNLQALTKANQSLHDKLFQNTQFYKKQIEQIEQQKFDLKCKLSNFQKYKTMIEQTSCRDQKQYLRNDDSIEFQYFVDKMEVLQKLNHNLIQKNNSFNQQNLKLIKQIMELRKLKKVQKNQWNFQFSQFQELLKENKELKKKINSQNSEEQNQHQFEPQRLFKKNKNSNVKAAQNETRIASLQNQLRKVQLQLYNIRLAKQEDQQRNSMLMKRWNQIFIQINPYFDIYQYTDVNLNERQWVFFDQNKDYKSLKDYQNKIYQLKKSISDVQGKLEQTVRYNTIQIKSKTTVIGRLQTHCEHLQSQLRTLSHFNNVLKDRLSELQEQTEVHHMDRNKRKRVHLINDQNQHQNEEDQNINQYPQLTNEKISQINLYPNQVTIDLLKDLLQKQQNQKKELLNVLKQRDLAIIQLHTELCQSIHTTKFEIIKPQYPNPNSLFTKIQIHQTLPNNILQSVTVDQMKIIECIKNQQQSIFKVHQSYKTQITAMENEYQNKIRQLSNNIHKWKGLYQNVYTQFSLLRLDLVCEQQKNNNGEINNLQNNNKSTEHINAQLEFSQDERANNQSMINQNYQHEVLGDIMEENNPKIIGDTTVHNLALTLKNYENQNSSILQTITKIREEYRQMKQTIQKVDELISMNKQLQNELSVKLSENQKLSQHVKDLQDTMESLENRLKQKQSEIKQIYEGVSFKQINDLKQTNQQLNKHNDQLSRQITQIKQQVLQGNGHLNPEKQIRDVNGNGSLLNNNEYQVIFSLHAKKNKQYLNEVEKNKIYEEKIHNLETVVRDLKANKINENTLGHVEMQQYKRMKDLFTNRNVLQTLRKANQTIISKNRQCERLKTSLTRKDERSVNRIEEEVVQVQEAKNE